jgi:hypothetical protein
MSDRALSGRCGCHYARLSDRHKVRCKTVKPRIANKVLIERGMEQVHRRAGGTRCRGQDALHGSGHDGDTKPAATRLRIELISAAPRGTKACIRIPATSRTLGARRDHLPLGLRAAKARAAASRPTSSSCRFRSSTIWSRRTRSGRNRATLGGLGISVIMRQGASTVRRSTAASSRWRAERPSLDMSPGWSSWDRFRLRFS